MTLQSSGTISLNEVHIELGASSGTVLSMNDTDVRTLAGYPTAGSSYGMNAFYGKSASSTATITMGRGLNGYGGIPRYGFSLNGKSQYYHYEGTYSTANFGSSSQTTGLITGHTVQCIQAVKYSGDWHLEVGVDSSSNSGFTNLKLYRQSATGTTYTLTRASAQFVSSYAQSYPFVGGYKFVWSYGPVSLYGSGSHTFTNTYSTMVAIYDMFEYAYNNSLKIYAEFS